MINDGKLVCGWLRSQVAVPEIMRRVVVEGGFPAASAGIIIYSAAQYMCPDTLAYLQDQANRAQSSQGV